MSFEKLSSDLVKKSGDDAFKKNYCIDLSTYVYRPIVAESRIGKSVMVKCYVIPL